MNHSTHLASMKLLGWVAHRCLPLIYIAQQLGGIHGNYINQQVKLLFAFNANKRKHLTDGIYSCEI